MCLSAPRNVALGISKPLAGQEISALSDLTPNKITSLTIPAQGTAEESVVRIRVSPQNQNPNNQTGVRFLYVSFRFASTLVSDVFAH